MHAKIGIQIRSGDLIVRAKSRDTLKPGDLLRAYIHPEETSNVYLIHTDHKTAILLNLTQQKIHSSTLVIPSLQEFYQVGGKSGKESFTIICSPNQMTEVQEIFSSGETPMIAFGLTPSECPLKKALPCLFMPQGHSCNPIILQKRPLISGISAPSTIPTGYPATS